MHVLGSYGVEESKAMLVDVGLELVEVEVVEAGDGQLEEGDADYGAKFLWIAAKKARVCLPTP